MKEIPNEMWRYGGKEKMKWVRRFCNRVWKGEKWKKGVIVPIVKEEEGVKADDYKKVTLISTLYKVYIKVLAERLREKVEEKGIIPENQAGFRKGLKILDNIYVINYLVIRQLEKREENLVAFFVNLKAAFDSIEEYW